MSKTPNGFRAVRMRGKTEVVYCVERRARLTLAAPRQAARLMLCARMVCC